MVLSIPDVARPVSRDTFTDLTTATVTIHQHRPDVVMLQFDPDVDDGTRTAVVRRCQSVSDVEDTLHTQASAVLAQCQTFLDDPAPTGAVVVVQVKLLTRVVAALLRIVLRRLGAG